MENTLIPDPLIIAKRGSFAFGGAVVGRPDGHTLHGDHGYAQYNIPVGPKKHPLVFWHGLSQSAKTWETTPDGREGFDDIFLRRGFSVYLIDQPRRGRAAQGTIGTMIPDASSEELLPDAFYFNAFRLGTWAPPESPQYFPNVSFPSDRRSLEQFLRQVVPNTGLEGFDALTRELQSNAASALFDEIGPAVLVTHSNGGQYGWRTAMKNGRVAAIVSYEPSTFAFPESDPPAAITYPPEAIENEPDLVSDEQFSALTKMPIQIVFGDNIRGDRGYEPYVERAEQFIAAINARGGDAEVLHLPEAGLVGNTHFPFADSNNLQVADLLSAWLARKGLDH